jgi:mevalonate kinase
MSREVKQTFRANGKLLLSGEYLVLKGAEALAIPLRYGQSLSVTTFATGNTPSITWKAYTPEAMWFEAVYSLPGLELLSCSDQPKAIRLQMILLTLSQLRPGLFSGDRSHTVETQLDFDPDWGFGSSSTLISVLANWAALDPYTLLNLSIGGSGYDIACAGATDPLFYRLNNMLPVVRKAAFVPPFASNMYFVYSGRKQRSDDSIRNASTTGMRTAT